MHGFPLACALEGTSTLLICRAIRMKPYITAWSKCQQDNRDSNHPGSHPLHPRLKPPTAHQAEKRAEKKALEKEANWQRKVRRRPHSKA
jgi:hypothetical protein